MPVRADWEIAADDDTAAAWSLPGRLTSWKGQGVAIDALGALDALRARRAAPPSCLAMHQGRKICDRAGRQDHRITKLGGTVSIVGHTTDMPAAYALADVILAPSTRPEAFGRVAAEASAMAKPVIVADHGGQRETVIEGQTGTRAEPGSGPRSDRLYSHTWQAWPERPARPWAPPVRHMCANISAKTASNRDLERLCAPASKHYG